MMVHRNTEKPNLWYH